MGNEKQPSLDNSRHWEAFCENKHDKLKVLSGEPLETTAKGATQVGMSKALAVDDYSAILSLAQCFDDTEDPRINRRRVRNLINMIVIAICAVIYNADGWADMRTWSETHRQWLQQFLQLPGGLPSRDTLRRTLSRLDPEAFQQAFLKWLKGLRRNSGTATTPYPRKIPLISTPEGVARHNERRNQRKFPIRTRALRKDTVRCAYPSAYRATLAKSLGRRPQRSQNRLAESGKSIKTSLK